ncbi:hypothetical protein CKY39_07915 [Variovorax boronicumulans]|uniref:Uncharacterized protein n=1 Tax=Variovorax boronicumulans TaxID=436515 RepID=A0A250DUF3_9BURK|nr:hypothetical protein CKY39_07915 [Variovorax boronicumulans]
MRDVFARIADHPINRIDESHHMGCE